MPPSLSSISLACFTAKGPSVQSIALAATKSGATSADMQQLAGLGNSGRSSEHIASQMVSKYCQSDTISLPKPYFAELPVAVRTSDEWVLANKSVALYLPHEWLSWLEGQEQVAGWTGLHDFWAGQSNDDPKLDCSPISEEPR